MGLYINPQHSSKETWLETAGRQVSNDTKWDGFEKDSLPIVLVDNGPFTAAGVAYSEDEYDQFMEEDGRPKKVYSVLKKDIMAVTKGELKDYILV